METLIILALTLWDIAFNILTLGWWSRHNGDRIVDVSILDHDSFPVESILKR